MDKIILSPSKYVQGYNIIERLETYTSRLGKNSLIIADDFITKLLKNLFQTTIKTAAAIYYLKNSTENAQKQKLTES